MAERLQSPLAGLPEWPFRGRDIALSELALQGHLNLRGDPAGEGFTDAVAEVLGHPLPLEPNTVSDPAPPCACWLGPDEWLLRLAEEASAGRVAAALEVTLDGRVFAVSDLSSAQTVLRLSGIRALEILAKGCTLDLHPRVFGPGQCAQTNLAQAPATLVPVVAGEVYEVIVRRSFADYLGRWLLDASR